MGLGECLERFNKAHPGDAVSVAPAKGRLTVELSGELDMQVSNDLSPLLDAALKECAAGDYLALDLSRVAYVASMGVGLLAGLLAKAGQASVALVLLDIPPRVRNIMDALGLLSFFPEERSEAGRNSA